MLEVKISDLYLKKPIILAAGILGTSFSSLKRVFEAGVGAVTTKSIGPIPKKGYKNPILFEVFPGTFINSVGLANPGINSFVDDIKKSKKYGMNIIVSIFGDSNESYKYVASKAQEAGADAIELNISCPHAQVSTWGSDRNLTQSLINYLRDYIKIPIFVKLNPNVTNLPEIAKAAQEAGADAVVAINTIRAMVIDVKTQKPVLHHKSGGLSGKSIHPIAINHVFDLYKELKIPIIGCGGVFNWKDAIEFFLAGASAIQVGTAFYKGLDIIYDINTGIKNYLQNYGYENIDEIIGLAHET
jgi:dihydroorotate dehydrogenase (NAD+) catalytic subunit